MTTPTQEPIEKNILNDPNGTVDKMQKELEQQAIAHQPSEGWDRESKIEDTFHFDGKGGKFWAHLGDYNSRKIVVSNIRTLLATARREESELWRTACMYNVDAETWERIRNAVHALKTPTSSPK